MPALYQYFPSVESILLTIYEDAASQVAKKFRAKMLGLMHVRMEVVTAKVVQLLLSEYEDNRLVLHQMVAEVPQLTLIPGAASLDRLLRASMRIYLLQFNELTDRDVERATFFLETIIVSSLRNYLSDRPHQLSRKEFLEDLSKVLVNYVRSQNWKEPRLAGLA